MFWLSFSYEYMPGKSPTEGGGFGSWARYGTAVHVLGLLGVAWEPSGQALWLPFKRSIQLRWPPPSTDDATADWHVWNTLKVVLDGCGFSVV